MRSMLVANFLWGFYREGEEEVAMTEEHFICERRMGKYADLRASTTRDDGKSA